MGKCSLKPLQGRGSQGQAHPGQVLTSALLTLWTRSSFAEGAVLGTGDVLVSPPPRKSSRPEMSPDIVNRPLGAKSPPLRSTGLGEHVSTHEEGSLIPVPDLGEPQLTHSTVTAAAMGAISWLPTPSFTSSDRQLLSP